MSERYTCRIHELPSDERPRERLLAHGPSVCSAAELLAIQIRTGTKERNALSLGELLIGHFSGLRGIACASIGELSQVKGIGEVKAIQIAAAIELGKRVIAVSDDVRPTIHSPQDVANILLPELRDAKKEHFKALLLDTKNRVQRIVTVSIGTLDSSLVHPREVFKEAIQGSAAAIIVAHNHPSGDPTPSAEDRRVTERLAEAGRVLGIDLLDHIIIGDNRWVSLKERGLL